MTHQFLAEICCLGLLAISEAGGESPAQIQPVPTVKPPQAIETFRLEFGATRQADVTLDPLKHRVLLGADSKHESRGPLRVDLRRGSKYTVQLSGEAFMSPETGAQADPYPGVMLFYGTDEEDSYAVRYQLLKRGESLSFTTPHAIDPKDEVFLLAFVLDYAPWADRRASRGSFKLSLIEEDQPAAEADTSKATAVRGGE